jgi:hypothetical protein
MIKVPEGKKFPKIISFRSWFGKVDHWQFSFSNIFALLEAGCYNSTG